MFNADSVQARLREKPFVPLRIVTSSGQAYDILHPDLVLVGRASLMVGTASNDNPTQYETVSRVAIPHISDMQDLPAASAAPPGANGAA